MRIKLAAAIIAASLALGGCAGTRIGDAIHFATAEFSNPVSSTNIYQVKNGYAAVLELAVSWRAYCWSTSYRALMADPVGKRLCANRRPVLRAMQRADERAFFAISAAENFVKLNPTLSAVKLVSEAASAVAGFRAAVPK